MNFIKIFFLFSISATTFSCSSKKEITKTNKKDVVRMEAEAYKKNQLTPAIYGFPSATNSIKSKLVMGQNLYETKCVKCHALPAKEKRNEEQWTIMLNKMQPKAQITDEEKRLIYVYVTSRN